MSERERARFATGSPFEPAIGFARAIRVGDRILVSGTAPVEDDGSSTPGNVGDQAERCFALIVRAVIALGGDAADIVRTRMYLTDAGDADVVGAVHARWFAAHPPAATMVVVSALLRPEWRVEVEAEAVVAD